jgi:hypothetical protein
MRIFRRRLIDVSEIATLYDITIPVALTGAVWVRCITDRDENDNLSSERSRIACIMENLDLKMPDWKAPEPKLTFYASFQDIDESVRLIKLVARCVKANDGELSITVMLSEENEEDEEEQRSNSEL